MLIHRPPLPRRRAKEIFTCFTRAKVQTLTCFTSTKVQILTQKKKRRRRARDPTLTSSTNFTTDFTTDFTDLAGEEEQEVQRGPRDEPHLARCAHLLVLRVHSCLHRACRLDEGARVTCFTSTNDARFTGFTSARVQALTQKALLG